MKLQSSNAYKISEFTRLFGDTNIIVEEGKDLKEVLGSIDEVVVYKSKAAGMDILIEDSTMIVNGKEEVEIKWKFGTLKTGDKVDWIVSLGVWVNEEIRVYKGVISTIVDRGRGDEGVAFDIEKDLIDPRAMAVRKLLSGKPDFTIEVDKMREWEGEWQND